MTNSWWLLLMSLATSLDLSVSSEPFLQPMANVFIFLPVVCDKQRETMDESTPPDRKVPKGTSEIDLEFTLSYTKSLVFFLASSKAMLVGWGVSSSFILKKEVWCVDKSYSR